MIMNFIINIFQLLLMPGIYLEVKNLVKIEQLSGQLITKTGAILFYVLFRNDSAKNRYNSIIDGIKNGCKFYKIINDYSYGTDVATYSCPQSLYSEKLDFSFLMDMDMSYIILKVI